MPDDKFKLIQAMIKMQKKFITLEHEHGLGITDYFAPDDDHAISGYRQEHDDIAKKVLDLAHAEKDSKP